MKKQHTQILTLLALAILIILAIVLFKLNPYYIHEPQTNTQSGSTAEVTTDTIEPVIDTSAIIAETLGENPTIEEIYALQNTLGSDVFLYVDCESITDEQAQNYCNIEKEFTIEFYARTTWGDVTREGHEYALTFDCSEIYLEAGQKTCEEFQLTAK